jgi:ABC-type uncharacterized transport system permease subunit
MKEKQPKGEEKGFFELLLDFGFQQTMTARYAKILYTLHLLVGLIVAIWAFFNGFQVSQSQGLITLLLAIVGYFFWILYVRIMLEFLVAIFRTADNIARVSVAGR